MVFRILILSAIFNISVIISLLFFSYNEVREKISIIEVFENDTVYLIVFFILQTIFSILILLFGLIDNITEDDIIQRWGIIF